MDPKAYVEFMEDIYAGLDGCIDDAEDLKLMCLVTMLHLCKQARVPFRYNEEMHELKKLKDERYIAVVNKYSKKRKASEAAPVQPRNT